MQEGKKFLALILGICIVTLLLCAALPIARAAESKTVVLADNSQLLALLFNPYTLRVERPTALSSLATGVNMVSKGSNSNGDPLLKNFGAFAFKSGPRPRIPRRPTFRSPIRPSW